MSSRVRPRTVALALLCLVVVAFAAATLTTTTDPETGFGGGQAGSSEQQGGQRTPTPDPTGDGQESDRPSLLNVDVGGVPTICVQWLQQQLVQLALLSALVALFLVLRWRDGTLVASAAVFVIAYPGSVLYLLLTSCQTGEFALVPEMSVPGQPAEPGGGLVGGEGGVTSPSLVTQFLLVAVIVTLGVVAVVVLTGDHEGVDEVAAEAEDEEDEPDPETGTDVAAVGEAAGRAADRIESESAFENEVYRAWSEMTDHLAVDHPDSSTPAEFAEAAVAAGMDPDDVDRLTDLFTGVRYGQAEVTDEREREAVETLRRIEAAYAGDES